MAPMMRRKDLVQLVCHFETLLHGPDAEREAAIGTLSRRDLEQRTVDARRQLQQIYQKRQQLSVTLLFDSVDQGSGVPPVQKIS